MTIHASHPFLDPEPARDPVRRFRGRLGGTVSLWTAGAGRSRAGLTISSLMLANGAPAHLLTLVDPDSDFAGALPVTGTCVVQLLQWRHRDLADAFAGLAPAPGGPFRLGSWEQTRWGPLLAGVSAWAGVRLSGNAREVGWSLLLDTVVEHVELGGEDNPLLHRRGRYLAGADADAPDAGPGPPPGPGPA